MRQEVTSAWFFVWVSRRGGILSLDQGLLGQAMAAADQRSASRIIVGVPERHGLLIGILNQKRWWTQTRARLIGQHIIVPPARSPFSRMTRGIPA